MDWRDVLGKVLKDLGTTQAGLARKTGIDQSLISKYLKDTMPSGINSLLLAAFVREAEHRKYLLSLSGISVEQRALIAVALADVRVDLTGIPIEDQRMVVALLRFYKNPENEQEKALTVLVRPMVEKRLAPRKSGTSRARLGGSPGSSPRGRWRSGSR